MLVGMRLPQWESHKKQLHTMRSLPAQNPPATISSKKAWASCRNNSLSVEKDNTALRIYQQNKKALC